MYHVNVLIDHDLKYLKLIRTGVIDKIYLTKKVGVVDLVVNLHSDDPSLNLFEVFIR